MPPCIEFATFWVAPPQAAGFLGKTGNYNKRGGIFFPWQGRYLPNMANTTTPTQYQILQQSCQHLQANGIGPVDTAVILGTGQGELLNYLQVLATLPYGQIPHFPTATVEFHKGNLVYGRLGGQHILVFQGRFHYYEGYTMQQVVYPVRVAKMLGARRLFISNAAGGMRQDLRKGDLVLIDDHLNLQTTNPLVGPNDEKLGTRFPDMCTPYDRQFSAQIKDHAQAMGIPLKTGVYCAVNGPQLETRAEYRFMRMAGADVVGMSTVPEVIAAVHASLPVAAISVVTDECDPDNLQPANIADIISVAGKADIVLAGLLAKVLSEK